MLCSLCRGKAAHGPSVTRALWKVCPCLAAASLRRRAPLELRGWCTGLTGFTAGRTNGGSSKGQTGVRGKEGQQEERSDGSCPNSNSKISCIHTNPQIILFLVYCTNIQNIMMLSWFCWNIEHQGCKVWGLQGTLIFVFEDVRVVPSQERPTPSLGHFSVLCHGIHVGCTVRRAWLMLRVPSAERRDLEVLASVISDVAGFTERARAAFLF